MKDGMVMNACKGKIEMEEWKVSLVKGDGKESDRSKTCDFISENEVKRKRSKKSRKAF